MELCLVLLANPDMHIIYTQIKPKLAKLSRVSYRGGGGGVHWDSPPPPPPQNVIITLELYPIYNYKV